MTSLMSVRRRPAPLARRAVSALLVAVWVIGLVVSIVHGSSHGHFYCSQHKTFEELRGTPASATEDARSWRTSPVATTNTHEACAFADLGVRAPLEEEFHLDVARPTPPPLAPAPPSIHIALPIPLLAVAPKASPPSHSV
jgi:hypothetical protein